jgi:hypothetical protein
VIVTLVLNGHKAPEDLAPAPLLSHRQMQHELPVVPGVSQTVDAGHGSHDDDILPLHEGRRSSETQTLDVLIDGGVLLNERVRGRNVGFGLVIVVVGDEVLHGIVGKERLQLPVELGRKGLVVAHDQRGPPVTGDDMGHGEGLAGSRGPQQDLESISPGKTLAELGDGPGLVPLGLVGRLQAEAGQPDRSS